MSIPDLGWCIDSADEDMDGEHGDKLPGLDSEAGSCSCSLLDSGSRSTNMSTCCTLEGGSSSTC
jgi:hypothetical protein